jgi:hypothetical protein
MTRLVSYQYKTADKIIVFIYFNLKFLGNICEGKMIWGSSVSIVSDYGLDDQAVIAGRGPGFFF